MIDEDSKYWGRYGRTLTPWENAAWDNYHKTVERVGEDIGINLKMYDPPSVMEHFSEIRDAFDEILALGTYYKLKDGPNEEDYEREKNEPYSSTK